MFLETDAYERYMGRWSRQLAPLMLKVARLQEPEAVLDVGTGTGVLASAVVDAHPAAMVTAIERVGATRISVITPYTSVMNDALVSYFAECGITVEAMAQLLIWVSSVPSLEDRGLRATVVLFCVRPDLIDGATLEQIGQSSGRTKQHVYNLVRSFRRATGFKP